MKFQTARILVRPSFSGSVPFQPVFCYSALTLFSFFIFFATLIFDNHTIRHILLFYRMIFLFLFLGVMQRFSWKKKFNLPTCPFPTFFLFISFVWIKNHRWILRVGHLWELFSPFFLDNNGITFWFFFFK